MRCQAIYRLPLFCLLACVFLVSRAQAADERTRIQVWGVSEQEVFAGFRAAVAEYERQNPHIFVDMGSPGGMEAGGVDQQKLMTTFAAGTPPDLVLMDRFKLASWAARGVFQPMDHYYERDVIDRSDIYEATLEECIYSNKIYGLPFYTDSRAMWCNMDILSRGGYTEGPRTWDELLEMTQTLTTYQPNGSYDVVAFAPLFGNSWLYMFGWLNGGEFMSADGRHCTLADPNIVEALAWMHRLYEPLGGAKKVEDFRAASQAEGAAEPFRAGRIAMQINENSSLDMIARYVPDLPMKAFPPPAPEGKERISWSGGFCWSIPTGAASPNEAWKLAKFLCSLDCWIYAGDHRVAREKTRVTPNARATYVPFISCMRSINKVQMERFRPNMPPQIADVLQVHIDLMDVSRFRPVTPVGNVLWDEHDRATKQVLFGNIDPQIALTRAQQRVQAELDKYFAPPDRPAYPFRTTVLISFGAVLLLGIGMWALAARRWNWSPRVRGEARAGLLFAAPWLIGFLFLMLGPMVASLIMAFSDFDMVRPARWAGLENFRNLIGFQKDESGVFHPIDPLFYISIKNTLIVTVVGVPLGIFVSLGLALLVNAEIRGIRIYRTLLYLPVVVPIVATAIIWIWLLNNEIGLNGLLISPVMRVLGLEPISFFGSPMLSRMGIVLMVTWAAGSSMVIWLAGLKGIPRSYYEAAAIDGAGPVQRFFQVTLPMLTPYLFFNLVMGTIGWLQVFTQAFVFIAPPGYGSDDSLLFYVLYLFVQGFKNFNMGVACAMAWILFVLVAGLTMLQFRLAKRWVHYDV